jgi:hypothetical protein
MKRIRIIILAALAILALGAIAAAAAEATEGPFWKVEGARLLAGEKHPLESRELKEFVFKAGAIEIKCAQHKLNKAFLLGSTGANAGSGEAITELEGCTVSGNGAGCKISGNKITTNVLSKTLDYANTARTGIILIFFKPVKGTIIAEIKFEGECTILSTTFEGSFAGEVWSGGKAVEVGSEPAAALTGEFNFPAVAITKDFIEKEGKLEEVKPSFKAFGKAATLVGRNEIKLTGVKKWCVSTGAVGSQC